MSALISSEPVGTLSANFCRRSSSALLWSIVVWKRFERIVDASGRRRQGARHLSDRSVRRSRRLGQCNASLESALESEVIGLPAVVRASPNRSLPWEIA